MNEKEERRRALRIVVHMAWVEKLLPSAEGGAGMLHSITKTAVLEGGARVIEDVFEDAQPLRRVEIQRQEWKRHWQVDRLEEFLENKPWKNDALQNQEETLPPMPAEELKRAASSYKTSSGLRADGFHPQVPLDFSTETCEHIVAFLAKVELLIPMNVTSERPSALFPT